MKRKVLATVLSMMMLSLAVAGCGTPKEESTAASGSGSKAASESGASSASSGGEAAASSSEKKGKEAKDIKVA